MLYAHSVKHNKQQDACTPYRHYYPLCLMHLCSEIHEYSQWNAYKKHFLEISTYRKVSNCCYCSVLDWKQFWNHGISHKMLNPLPFSSNACGHLVKDFSVCFFFLNQPHNNVVIIVNVMWEGYSDKIAGHGRIKLSLGSCLNQTIREMKASSSCQVSHFCMSLFWLPMLLCSFDLTK